MTPTKSHRLLLFVSGLVAAIIGGAILVEPHAFHATNGITLGIDPSLLSEVRAPGGLLLALGAMILTGAVRASFAVPATATSAVLFLSYGFARLVSLALDGVPANGLLVAMAIELGLGITSTLALQRAAERGQCVARHDARTRRAA